MNTKRVLLISSDNEFISIVKISALTLTKLNCQVTIDSEEKPENALNNSSQANLDLIIVDNDLGNSAAINLIKQIREKFSSNKMKVITVYSTEIEREKIFAAGCQAIMSKSEFKIAMNNILVF